MRPFVFGSKNKTDILDLTKTAPLLEAALAYVRGLAANGKTMLIVGGKPEMRDLVRKTAVDISMPYVAGRWLGGTLTNYSEIKKRIKLMVELTTDRDAGSLAKKYTKKERLMIDREIARLEERFTGLVTLDKLPHAVLVVDSRHESIAVLEAHELSIPVIGIMNTDCDVSTVTYPIVGNDASRESVAYFLNAISDAYREGLKGHVAPPSSEVPVASTVVT